MADTSKTSDTDLRATAYHEAGHCVAALIYGLTVRYVTIIPGKSAQGQARLGHASIRRPQNGSVREADLKGCYANLISHYAGAVCEAKFTQKPVDPSSMAADHKAAVDMVSALLGENTTPATLRSTLDDVLLKTCDVFMNPKAWRAVRRIADELIVRRRLTGGEVNRLFKAGV